MKTDNFITNPEVKTIDLYMTDGESIFADISIDYPYVYYCIGTEDTREDGRVNLDPALRDLIVKTISQPAKENAPDSSGITIRLKAITSEGKNITFDNESHQYAKEIISLLSESFDEFLFLDNFKRLI